MARMKVAQVGGRNQELTIVERDVPEPGPRQVRIKVEACGVCHSDMFTVAGAWPGIKYPRVPGHEVIGKIDALGADVPDWKQGAARVARAGLIVHPSCPSYGAAAPR